MSQRTTTRQPSPAHAIPKTYRQLRRWLAFIMRIFFRRIEVVGLENVPADRGGILVAWHPNGLVDPALILTSFPHQVVFGARHTLFRYPILGRFVRALGAVPIYRRIDTPARGVDEQRTRNDDSLDALADSIARGSFSALFPEGYSHDTPFLHEVKTGAGRLYYRARTRSPLGQSEPVIIPVGLHYDQKRVFRSGVLIVYHPPLVLAPEIDVTPSLEEDSERVRELARALTERIERELKLVIFETETWDLHRLLHRARKLIRAERANRAGVSLGGTSMDERIMGFARMWTGYNERVSTNPQAVTKLRQRVERYDRDLRSLRIEDHELDHPPDIQPWYRWLLALQIVTVLFLLPPFLVIGAIVNLPPAALVILLAKLIGKEHKDIASLKLVGGIILFPLTWAFWGWLAARGVVNSAAWFFWIPPNGILAALGMVLLSMAGAVVLLVYLGLALATWRAIRVRFTRGRRARSMLRLKVERARLCDELLGLAGGLDLPGAVGVDGRVSRVLR